LESLLYALLEEKGKEKRRKRDGNTITHGGEDDPHITRKITRKEEERSLFLIREEFPVTLNGKKFRKVGKEKRGDHASS